MLYVCVNCSSSRSAASVNQHPPSPPQVSRGRERERVCVFLSCEITSETKMIVVTEAWVRCEIYLTMFLRIPSKCWDQEKCVSGVSKYFSPGILNFVFCHICAILWLIRDYPVVSSGGNRSIQQKPPPNSKLLAAFSHA